MTHHLSAAGSYHQRHIGMIDDFCEKIIAGFRQCYARSKLLLAVENAKTGNFDKCDQLIEEANACLVDAHKSQTELLQQEARGNHVEVGFITVHAQDHLMTTLLLKDIISTLIDVYKK